MKNKVEKKQLENNGEYIVIHKETLINYIFITILVIALVMFLSLLFLSVSRMFGNSSNGINAEIIDFYTDEHLNITYPIPGGNWSLVEVENDELEKTVQASWGDDNYFSIDDDTLTEEVLSLFTVNEATDSSFREFMSFTFMPNVSYEDADFISFCEASFKKNIEDSGEYDNYELYETVSDEYGGVMMKATITQTVETDNGPVTDNTYYTQYIKRIGANIGVITYGSLIEDDTVDKYLQYFFNNVISEKSLIS